MKRGDRTGPGYAWSLSEQREVEVQFGSVVELSPACDLWMRGARFATVVGTCLIAGQARGTLLRSTHPSVRRLVRLSSDYVLVPGGGQS